MLRSIREADSTPQQDAHTLEWIFRQPVVDYLAYQSFYTTARGKRALALVIITASGTVVARRVTPTNIRETQKLRNWMEAYVWLDMPSESEPTWTRDMDEEELWREADRVNWRGDTGHD